MKRNLIVGTIVILVLFALGALSVPPIKKYLYHLRRAKEVALQQNLWTMRRAIDFYAQDKEEMPQSLKELVSVGYPREIPADPFTKSNQTWVVQREKESSVPNTPPGIIDVHSDASGADKNGKPYNQY